MQEMPATATHERPAAPAPPGGVRDGSGTLDDPRFLQVLTTEHWSLLTSRSLAYNEAFTRTGMFLTFLSMSFVGLALVGPPLSFSRDFLVIAVVVLVFDFLIGLLTFLRVGGCNVEDLRAMHGMNRIRHGYVTVVPPAAPYFVSGTYDDAASVTANYNPSGRSSLGGDLVYGLSTSLGMVGLIVALVGGVLSAVITLLVGGPWPLPLLVGAVAAVLVIGACIAYAFRGAAQAQSDLPVAFPREPDTRQGQQS